MRKLTFALILLLSSVFVNTAHAGMFKKTVMVAGVVMAGKAIAKHKTQKPIEKKKY